VPSLPVLARIIAATALPHENGQLGTEYAAEGLRQLLLQERRCSPLPRYMALQTDLSEQMRGIIVDWLVEVHSAYKMRRETLYLAVSLLDRYLCLASQLPRERLQLVGVTALLIAAKYEEVNPFEVRSATELTDQAYSAAEILRMECSLLCTLEFEVACPTIAHFMPLLQAVSRVKRKLDTGLYAFFRSANSKVSELCEDLAWYLAELALLDVKMTEYLPSQVAAAAVLISNRLFGRSPTWPAALEQICGHSEASLSACCKDLEHLRQAAPGCDLQQVPEKYSAVARISLRGVG